MLLDVWQQLIVIMTGLVLAWWLLSRSSVEVMRRIASGANKTAGLSPCNFKCWLPRMPPQTPQCRLILACWLSLRSPVAVVRRITSGADEIMGLLPGLPTRLPRWMHGCRLEHMREAVPWSSL